MCVSEERCYTGGPRDGFTCTFVDVLCCCEGVSHGAVWWVCHSGFGGWRPGWWVSLVAARHSRCLICFDGGQLFDVALVLRSGGLVFHVAPLGRCLSVSRPTCPSVALICKVWQKPAVPGATQLVSIVWPFTGDLRGGLGQILQRGIRVAGDQVLRGLRAASHLCLLTLGVLGACVPWLDGSLAASLVGVRGCAGRLGPRGALGGDTDTLCGSGCSCGCWRCCCWCCWSCCCRRCC